MLKLSINIDHIATLREARKGKEPDPLNGALICLKAGADGITFHLREDRRHIQDKDVKRLRSRIRKKLNMEMAPIPEMVKIAQNIKVDQVTFVPEKRREVTTEGGLNVAGKKAYLRKLIKSLRSQGILTSLFINPQANQVRASFEVGAEAIEIHTGSFCQAQGGRKRKELLRIKKIAALAKSLGLKVFAGHGLNYTNVREITKIKEIEELNIGHSIISYAVFNGLQKAVKDMKRLLR